MAVVRIANGAEAKLGLMLEAPASENADGQRLGSIGRPYIPVTGLADPAAPTSAEGAAGNITGDVQYAQAHFDADGFPTAVSAWADSLTLAAKKATVGGLVDNSAASWSTLYRRHRADNTVAWTTGYAIKSFFDQSGAIADYTDDLAITSTSIDYSQRPPEENLTGQAGYRTKTLGFDDATLDTDFQVIEPAELGTGIGRQDIIQAGQLNKLTLTRAFRGGLGVQILTSAFGEFTKYGEASGAWSQTPTAYTSRARKYAWPSLAAARDLPRSLWAYAWPGGSQEPFFLFGGVVMKIGFAFKKGTLVSEKTEIGFASRSEIGPGVPSAHLDSLAFLRGTRTDAGYLTDGIVSKVSAVGTGYAQLLTKVGSEGYGATSYTRLEYDANGIQTKRAATPGEWQEMYTATGNLLGKGDAREGRLPVQIICPGDISTLEADDTITFPARIDKLGGSGTGYTGVTPYQAATPRFVNAQSLLSVDGVVIPYESLDVDIDFGRAMVMGSGEDEAFGADVDEGARASDLTLVVRATGDTWKRYRDLETVLQPSLTVAGERIWISPGTRSIFRETLGLAWGRMKVVSVSQPWNNAGSMVQTVKIQDSNPQDSSELITPYIITREEVSLP